MTFSFAPLFDPIARLAIARGLRFAEVAEQLRLAFFRSAKAEAGAGATDSKLSVMTGLQRRDIGRLRALAVPPSAAPNPLARIVAVWRADPRFAGRPLPRKGDLSFDALAAEIRRDIHPRTMLDQLIAAGTVSSDAGMVTLQAESYLPLAGSDDQLAYLSQNVGDHLAGAVSNVVAAPVNFEQAVHYNQLSAEAVAELDALWRSEQARALAAVNARALALQSAKTGACRFRAGAYFWQQEEDPS